ncbi:MAG: TadE family protein [Thermoguttaceae bacterium]
MLATKRVKQRRGATVVEFAIVAPLVLLLIFGEMLGGLGVCRYQELAHLARDCARYASTHGGAYQREGIDRRTGVPAVDSSDELRSLLARGAMTLDPSQIRISVSWTGPSGVEPVNMPSYDNTDPALAVPGQSIIQNSVVVTLSYQWSPGFGVGPITLTSTSEMPMCY